MHFKMDWEQFCVPLREQNKRKRKKSEVVRRLKRDFVVGVGGQQVGGEAGKAGGGEEGGGAEVEEAAVRGVEVEGAG